MRMSSTSNGASVPGTKPQPTNPPQPGLSKSKSIRSRKVPLRLVPEALVVRFPDLSYTSPDLGAGARVRVALRQNGLVILDEGRAVPPGE